MPELSLLDYIKGRLAARLPEGLRPSGWQPLDDEAAAALWEEAQQQGGAETRMAPQAKAPEEQRPAPVPSRVPAQSTTTTAPSPAPTTRRWLDPQNGLTWMVLAALGLALLAQASLEPRPHIPRHWQQGVLLYLPALALWGWALLKGHFLPHRQPEEWVGDQDGPWQLRPAFLIAAAILGVGAFFGASDNRFTFWGVSLWIGATAAIWATFGPLPNLRAFWKPLRPREWAIKIRPWHLLLLVVAGVALYFRYVHLQSVGAEMFSDHAEKLLDVADVLAGKTHVFFPRNAGREAIHIYLTACLIKCFGMGYNFLTLKFGMATMGLLMLPFVYLLGKEIGGKWAGMWATLFTAFAYWPNVLARSDLRLTLYPAFAAPTLYFFVRGLKRGKRSDYLWTGLFLGAGLYGYSAFRVMPLAILIGAGIYLLYQKHPQRRERALLGVLVAAVVAFVVFVPLFRYITQDPRMFFYRSATRFGQLERPYPGNPIAIFFTNLFKISVMPFWDDGQVWVHSIPNRPALDWISGALFALGLVVAALRWARRRSWEDAFLLISIPVLFLPSSLALAFPNENPCLNRTGGAYIPIFIVVGIAVAALQKSLWRNRPRFGPWAGAALAVTLALLSAQANYRLVFHDFARIYRNGTWNTSALGEVVHGFVAMGNDPHHAWVVPYPYWVDTRLVAINAGLFPEIPDLALAPDKLAKTKDVPSPKLFILKPEDKKSLDALQHLYPHAIVRLHPSPLEGKDFVVFFVP